MSRLKLILLLLTIMDRLWLSRYDRIANVLYYNQRVRFDSQPKLVTELL